MIFFGATCRKILLSSLIFITIFIFISETAFCSTLSFDEYAVFCCYFKISGDKPSDQDIEELCFKFNRPNYTSFKPSEMFTKKSLLKEKNRVDEKIKSITSDSTFLWKLEHNLSNNNDVNRYFNIYAIDEVLPQPTPYINPIISEKNKRKIKKAISLLLKKHPEKIKNKDVEIIITLKPEKFEYKHQKRNIVKQNVVLPIRYVIFHPTKVQILDESEIVQ